MKKSLAIISSSETGERSSLPVPKTRREETQAIFERKWQVHPEQFDASRNCMERERIERTVHLIQNHLDVKDCLVADLGCGSGALACRLRDLGAKIHAVDVARNALKKLDGEVSITLIQSCLPVTTLCDDFYDLVISTELIAYLHQKEHRLFFNELSRLVKPKGKIICSSQIDINSEDALEQFAALAATEIEISAWKFSYHSLYIRMIDYLRAPQSFSEASLDQRLRERGYNERYGISKYWFWWNSYKPIGLIWKSVHMLFSPFIQWTRQSRKLLLLLEKLSFTLWGDSAISHAIFAGTRKPLAKPLPETPPVERKQKRTVWE